MRAVPIIRMPQRRSAASWTAAAALSLPLLLGAAAVAQDEEAPAAPRQPPAPLAEEVLSPTSVLTARILDLEPGHQARAHSHSGSVFVYVLEGDILSQINDEPAVLYHAGDSWFEAEGVVHTQAENVSDVNPVRLLVVSVAPPGEPFAKAPTQ